MYFRFKRVSSHFIKESQLFIWEEKQAHQPSWIDTSYFLLGFNTAWKFTTTTKYTAVYFMQWARFFAFMKYFLPINHFTLMKKFLCKHNEWFIRYVRKVITTKKVKLFPFLRRKDYFGANFWIFATCIWHKFFSFQIIFVCNRWQTFS